MGCRVDPAQRVQVVGSLGPAAGHLGQQDDDQGVVQVVEQVGDHVDDTAQPDGEAGLLAHLAAGGVEKGFLVLDVAARQAPVAAVAGPVHAPADEHPACAVADDHRDARARVEVVDKAAADALLPAAAGEHRLAERGGAVRTEGEALVVAGQGAGVAEYLIEGGARAIGVGRAHVLGWHG